MLVLVNPNNQPQHIVSSNDFVRIIPLKLCFDVISSSNNSQVCDRSIEKSERALFSLSSVGVITGRPHSYQLIWMFTPEDTTIYIYKIYA